MKYTLAMNIQTDVQYSLRACSPNCHAVHLVRACSPNCHTVQRQLSHNLKFSALCRVMSWISTPLLEDPKLKGVVKVLWIIFISTFIFTAVTVSLPLARHK